MQEWRQQREAIKALIKHYKETHVCVVCGDDNPEHLTFHHRNPLTKKFSIANAPRATHSIARVQEEIRKCDVVCFDCHKLIHGNIGNAREHVTPPTIVPKGFKRQGQTFRFSLDA